MPVNKNYKKLCCYLKMDKSHKDCFDTLADCYGEALNTSIYVEGSLFTLHDFDHHCYDLMRIFSNALCNLEEVAQLEESDKLSEHELFLLNLAILFHDYGMSNKVNLEVSRKNHAKASADFLKSEWDDTNSPLHTFGSRVGLSNNDINALSEIVRAHSDDKEVDPSQTGIHATELRDSMPASAPKGKVRAKFLAGLLRIADELDITSERLGNTTLAQQLNPEKPENEESIRHWEKLKYFNSIEMDQQELTTLNLVVDDAFIRKQLDKGDREEVLERISEVSEKINREWKDIKATVINRTRGARQIVRFDNIQIKSDLNDINEYITIKNMRLVSYGKNHNLVALNKLTELEGGGCNCDKPCSKSKQCVQILNDNLKEKVDTVIRQDRLIKPGHFLMHDGLCARDWVSVPELLEKQEIFNEVILAMALHIREHFECKDTVILGIDLDGTLLGIRVAAMLQCPFAFLVPPQQIENAGGLDKDVDISKFKYAIFITDIVATGYTIQEVAKNSDLGQKLLATYTVLYRKPIAAMQPEQFELKKPVYCISDTFDIEVIDSSNCDLRAHQGCLGFNKVVR